MGNGASRVANHGQDSSKPKTTPSSSLSSRCVTETDTATHSFEVPSFSRLLEGMGAGKFVASSTFRAGGRGWNIKLYPDGLKEEHKGHASVFLCLADGAADVWAKYTLSLLDRHGQVSQLCNVSMKSSHTFESVGNSWGYPRFVEKSKLEELLRLDAADCFTIRCDLTVILGSRAEDLVSSSVKIPHSSNIHHHFERMLKDGKGTDVTFSVDGQLFRAHRCVLAARSPVFDAEFFGPMKDNAAAETLIQIEDMEPLVFESLLHFMYTDRIVLDGVGDDDRYEAMQHLLVAADRYGLDRLKMMCEAELRDSVDVETVATTIVLAEQHHCVDLKDACLTFVASRDVLGAVMKTSGFKHLTQSSPSVLTEILDKIAKS